MQGKAKTIILVVVLLALAAVAAYMYLPSDKPDTTIPTGPATGGNAAPAPGNHPAPADEPTDAPARPGQRMSG